MALPSKIALSYPAVCRTRRTNCAGCSPMADPISESCTRILALPYLHGQVRILPTVRRIQPAPAVLLALGERERACPLLWIVGIEARKAPRVVWSHLSTPKLADPKPA